MHKVLIDGQWRAADAPHGGLRASNPATGEPLKDEYPVCSWADLDMALESGRRAAEAMFEAEPGPIVGFLRGYASAIEGAAGELAAIAHEETALPASPRFEGVEIPRTANQLRLAADAAESRAWREPVVDESANLASCMGPLGGPVWVIGPNNFPFAYNGVAGGDFASAIAAQNPVIAKAHPLHPTTTRRLAELAHKSANEAGLPAGAVQLVYDMKPEDGLKLAGDPRLAALGFTGSRRGGLALKEACDRAGTPVYLEMSAVNPVFVLEGSASERREDFPAEYVGSCTLGAGQFCTSPGLVILPDNTDGRAVRDTIAEAIGAAPAGTLLSADLTKATAENVETLIQAGGSISSEDRRPQDSGAKMHPLMLTCSGAQFLASHQAMQTEAFGPIGVAVMAKDLEEMIAIARVLEGSLTASIYSAVGGGDDAGYARLAPHLRMRCGRLLNDKMPTGVAVSPAMNHGGPFPATGHPGFTAVGMPGAIRRFAALHSYDHVRPERLPTVLREKLTAAAGA